MHIARAWREKQWGFDPVSPPESVVVQWLPDATGPPANSSLSGRNGPPFFQAFRRQSSARQHWPRKRWLKNLYTPLLRSIGAVRAIGEPVLRCSSDGARQWCTIATGQGAIFRRKQQNFKAQPAYLSGNLTDLASPLTGRWLRRT